MKTTIGSFARLKCALFALLGMFVVASSALAQQTASRRAGGRRAFVNGVNMYYLVQGTGGVPLILLHGAFSNIQTDFGKMLPTLSNELLRQLRITKADFFGYSMGGAIGTYVAVRHPELVRKLIFAGGASYNVDGFYPELMEGEKKMKPEDFAGTPWLKAYTRIAPNPGDWPKLVIKIRDLDVNWRGLSDDQLRSIKVPVMLIVGDADVVRPEHVVQMFRLLGGGAPGDIVGLPRSQLAVLPGTTHVTLITKTDWLLSMVRPFLDAPLPRAKR